MNLGTRERGGGQKLLQFFPNTPRLIFFFSLLKHHPDVCMSDSGSSCGMPGSRTHRRSQVEGAAMYRPLVSQLYCMWSNRKPKDSRKEENQ